MCCVSWVFGGWDLSFCEGQNGRVMNRLMGLILNGFKENFRGDAMRKESCSLARRKPLLTMRPCAGAAVGVVSELVDMHPPLRIRVVAFDVVGNRGWSRLGGLFESHGATDVGIATEDCDCTRWNGQPKGGESGGVGQSGRAGRSGIVIAEDDGND